MTAELATQTKAPLAIDENGIRLNSVEEAWRFANIIAKSPFCPKDMKDPGAIVVAIQLGNELGVKPMQALQGIAVINGRPTIWGDLAVAIVRSSPLCEYIEETDDGNTATCKAKRRGEPSPVVRTFSMDDAKKAGLAGKQGPWTSYPKRMRQCRARAFALRDAFADLLKGMGIREEVQDYRIEPKQTPETVFAQIEAKLQPATPVEPQAEAAPVVADDPDQANLEFDEENIPNGNQ